MLVSVPTDRRRWPQTGMTPLQVDVLRVSLEKMRSVPLLRSQCLDVRSPVAVCVRAVRLVLAVLFLLGILHIPWR